MHHQRHLRDLAIMTGQLTKAYKWVQALSLDVVLGSGLLNLAIARYYGVHLSWPVLIGLILAVWSVYTLDHLSDAQKVKRCAATHRHRFHQQHFKTIRLVLLIVVALGLSLLPLMPLPVLKWGLGCGLFVGCYFLLIQFSDFWPKELLIAIGYTCGVFLGPLSLGHMPLNLFQFLLIPQVLFLAMANLLIFSGFDYESDRQDGHYSMAIHLGVRTTRRLALGIVITGIALSMVLFLTAYRPITQEVQVLVVVMNLLLLMLLLRKESFRQHELYRVVGDGIFFIPALLLLYGR